MQPGLCLLDVIGTGTDNGDVVGTGTGNGDGIDEVVARAAKAALATYKHAYFDQRDLVALVDRVGRERGERLEIGCFLNDRRMDFAQQPSPAASELRWIRKQDSPGFEPLILDVEDAPGGLRCTLHMDTRWVDPADAERLLWNLEAVAVRSTMDSSSGK